MIWEWFINHELLWHEVILTFLGLSLWFGFKYKMYKQPFDDQHKKARFKQWRQEESDDIFIAFIIGCLLVMLDDEILVGLNIESNKFHDAVYLIGGPFSDLMFEGFVWFQKNKKKIVDWIVRKFKA